MVMAQSIMQDTDVFTSDGEKLGTVAEVRGEVFKVDVPMMLDYWLPVACVTSADATGVQLECSKDEVEEHKADAPASM